MYLTLRSGGIGSLRLFGRCFHDIPSNCRRYSLVSASFSRVARPSLCKPPPFEGVLVRSFVVNGGPKWQKEGLGAKTGLMSRGTKSTLYYIAAVGVLAFGLSYAAVPLYRIFCQAYSYGGTVQVGHDAEKVESMERVQDRVIKVRFNADTAASMTWNFRPQQSELKVHPGETALAFYTARNPMDRPVIGISTYNVIPFDAGQYFNKIQCFCFEEQQLNPHEEMRKKVSNLVQGGEHHSHSSAGSLHMDPMMDPEFADDPKMQTVDMLTLSYTFFEAREGLQLPVPNFTT